MSDPIFAGIEAGGTKILCALADRAGRVSAQTRIATGEPHDTIAQMAAFFHDQAMRHGPVAAGGIASFGPLDCDAASIDHGCLVGTPKPGWSGINLLNTVRGMIDAPAAIDTDVNCAALAEAAHGAGQGLDRLCYITVGTGIGVGLVENGRTNAGASHPEAGHMRVGRAPGDHFAGICPSHGDCVEGLACGPAIAVRWSAPAETLPTGHVAWDHQAYYIAALCANLTYAMRPQRIVIGGGVMEQPDLLGKVRGAFAALTAGYALDRFSRNASTYLCAPQLVDPSPGLAGAFMLARRLGEPVGQGV